MCTAVTIVSHSANAKHAMLTDGGETYEYDIYKVHKFANVGTSVFSTNVPIVADILIVAGGGGGGHRVQDNVIPNFGFAGNVGGGGGGAGGLIHLSNVELQPGVYDVAVGAGGEIGVTDFASRNRIANYTWPGANNGDRGGNSKLGEYVAIGGGGGSGSQAAGVTQGGGSGGGGGSSGAGPRPPGGLGTPGQGNNGGTGGSSNWTEGGGGGGFLSAGANNVGAGAGIVLDITGERLLYSQGGRGGGPYTFSTLWPVLPPNIGFGGRGNGGGAGHHTRLGQRGSSGTVVVRYAVSEPPPLNPLLSLTPSFSVSASSAYRVSAHACVVDSLNQAYVANQFVGTSVVSGPGGSAVSLSADAEDAAVVMTQIVKLSHDGHVQWGVRIRNSSAVPLQMVALPENQVCVLFAYSNGYEITSPDQSVTSVASGEGAALVLLNANGSVVWSNNLTVNVVGGTLTYTSPICDLDGNIVLATSITNGVTYAGLSGSSTTVNGVVSAAHRTLVILRYSPGGVIMNQYVQTFQHMLNPMSMAQDTAGRVYIVGHSRTSSGTAAAASLGNGVSFPAVGTGNMAFLFMYNNDLTIAGLYTLNSAATMASRVCCDDAGCVYIAGVSRLGVNQQLIFESPPGAPPVSYGTPSGLWEASVDDYFIAKLQANELSQFELQWMNRVSGAVANYLPQLLQYHPQVGVVAGFSVVSGHAHSRRADMAKASHVFSDPRRLLKSEDSGRHDRFLLQYNTGGELRDVVSLHSTEPNVYAGITYAAGTVAHVAAAFFSSGQMLLCGKYQTALEVSRKNWTSKTETFSMSANEGEETAFALKLEFSVTNVSLQILTTSVVITYDNTTDVSNADEIVLTGDLVAGTLGLVGEATDYSAGFALSDLSPGTLFNGFFALKYGDSVSPSSTLSFRTLHDSVVDDVVVSDAFTATVQYSPYTSFLITKVILGGDLAGAQVKLLPGASDFTQGFVIANLVTSTSYSADFALVGLGGHATAKTPIAVQTVTPPPVSNVSAEVTSTSVLVTYDPYVSLQGADEIVLSEEFAGRSALLSEGAQDFSSGFVVSGLSANTLYNGTFVIKKGNSESAAVDLSFRTFHEPPSPVVVNAALFTASIEYPEYPNFAIVDVVLEGGLDQTQTSLLPDASDFSSGFVLSNLAADTEYSGTVTLSGSGQYEYTKLSISVRTLPAPPISNVSVQILTTGVVVTYDSYADIPEADQIVFGGGLLGVGTLGYIEGESDFSSGFVLSDLNLGTQYSGTFTITKGIMESPSSALSFRTLHQSPAEVVATPNIFDATVHYAEFTSFAIESVVLRGGFGAATATLLPGAPDYTLGFSITNLAADTEYTGNFALVGADGHMSADELISIQTSPAPLVLATSIEVNSTGATVTYTPYVSLEAPDQIVLSGALSGAAVSFLPGHSKYSAGFVLSALDSNTLYDETFVIRKGASESPQTALAFLTLHAIPSSVVVVPSKLSAIVQYAPYSSFTVDGVVLGGHLETEAIALLSGQTDYSSGFQIVGLTWNLMYSGAFKLTGTQGEESPVVQISFSTLPPAAISPPVVQISSYGATVTYSTYLDVPEADEVILEAGLEGLSLTFREGLTDFSSGFVFQGLSTNTLYSGTFRLKNGELISLPASLSFTTLFAPVVNPAVEPDMFTAIVTYAEYTDFASAPSSILLSGDLAGRTVSFLQGQSNYSTGFMLSDLTGNTSYTGAFQLRNGTETSPSASISFQTLLPSQVLNVELSDVTIFRAKVTYDQYLDIPDPNEVVLGGSLSSASVELLQGETNYASGFLLRVLSDTSYGPGTFILKKGTATSQEATLPGFTTLPPPRTYPESAVTGGTAYNYDIYKVHRYTNVGNSSLTVHSTVIAEVLVVAGGGGGGWTASGLRCGGGGGGAGGLIHLKNIQLEPGTYSVRVGGSGDIRRRTQTGNLPGGGSLTRYFGGNLTTGHIGSPGVDTVSVSFTTSMITDSRFGDYVAIGGGGGQPGNHPNSNSTWTRGQSGGSGGGGGSTFTSSNTTTRQAGAGTPGQGFSGGGGAVAPSNPGARGAGGGGYLSPGLTSGTPGQGVMLDITGENLLYSRGGEGGQIAVLFNYVLPAPLANVGHGGDGNGGRGGETGSDRNFSQRGSTGTVVLRYVIADPEPLNASLSVTPTWYALRSNAYRVSAHSIAVDGLNNVHVAGQFTHTSTIAGSLGESLSLTTGSENADVNMACLVAYNTQGAVQWALQIRNSSAVPVQVASSPQDEVYALFMYSGGYQISNANVEIPGAALASGNGAALVKLGPGGAISWINHITMNVVGSTIMFTDLGFNSDGHVIFATSLNNTVTFGGQSESTTTVNAIASAAHKTLAVVKYSPQGVFLQHHVQSFLHNVVVRAVAVDPTNRVYVVGHTRTTSGTAVASLMENDVEFPPVTTVNMSFTLVFNNTLSLVTLYALDSADVQLGCICTDENGNFYLSGVSRLGGGQVMTFPSPSDGIDASYQTGFNRAVLQFALDDHFVGKFRLDDDNLVKVEWLNRISGASQNHVVQFLKYNVYSGLACGVSMLRGYAHSRPSDMSKVSNTFEHARKLLVSQEEARHDRFVLHYTNEGVLRDVLNVHTEEPSVYTGTTYVPANVTHAAAAFSRGGNMFLAGKFRSFLRMSRKNWDALVTTFDLTGQPEEETGYVMRIGNAEAGPDGSLLPTTIVQPFLRAPLVIELLRNTGQVFIPTGVQLRFKRRRFDAPTDVAAQEQIQSWINHAVDVSLATPESPFNEFIPVEETVNVYTEGDFLHVYDQVIDMTALGEDFDNVFYTRQNDFVYSIQVVFYGGSGGAEVTNLGKFFSGAMTFGADQVVYDSVAEDGNVTVFAGIVTQGMGDQQNVSAPRIPNSEFTYQATVSLAVQSINNALSNIRFVHNTTDDTVSVPATATHGELSALALSMFNTPGYARNEREHLAIAFINTLSSQIANDLPDEFRSAKEARARVGLTAQQVDFVLQTPFLTLRDEDERTTTHPLHALIRNIVLTSWQEGVLYNNFGSSLLRNIVQSVCVLKPSRIVTNEDTGWQHIRFRAGDEIVVYVTFTGTVRVSANSMPERFGLTTTQIEDSKADLDSASWLKLVLRFVV